MAFVKWHRVFGLSLVGLLSACTLPFGEPPLAVEGGDGARVYECRDDYAFLVRVEGDRAQLVLPDRTLTPSPSTDGFGDEIRPWRCGTFPVEG